MHMVKRGTQMKDISLSFSYEDKEVALKFASALKIAGFNVYTINFPLEGFDRSRADASVLKIDNFANILLMSQKAWVKDRPIVDVFCRAIENKQTNIQIVALDSSWREIRDQKINLLKSLSHPTIFDVHNEGRAKDTVNAVISVDKKKAVTQLNRTNIRNFLAETYDEIIVKEDVNELNGKVNFQLLDGTFKMKEGVDRYLVIFPNASVDQTKIYINENLSHLIDEKSNLTLLRSYPARTFTDLQVQTYMKQFGVKPTRFEDLLEKYKLKNDLPAPLTSMDEFTIQQSWIKSSAGQTMTLKTDDVAQACMKDISLQSEQLIILTGAGGGGKTHFARHIHDQISHQGREVFLLSAASANDSEITKISSLYDIYKACCLADGSIPVSKNIFNVKFLASDPIFIVDGLEEIITVSSLDFDVVSFFQDCLEKGSQNANGKIIITSRDGNLPDDLKGYCSFFEIQPFTADEAVEFFNRSLKQSPDHAKIAIQIFKLLEGSESSFPPYFCDLIVELIVRGNDLNSLRNRLTSNTLGTQETMAEIFNAILEREDKFKITWPSYETLRALGRIAKACSLGHVKFDHVFEIMEEAVDGVDRGRLKLAVRDFVLFKYVSSGDYIIFRYDFLTTYFLSNYLIDAISDADQNALIDDASRQVFISHLRPGSAVLNWVLDSANIVEPQKFAEGIHLLIHCSSKDLSHITPRKREQITSNLTFLKIVWEAGLKGTFDCTESIEELFGSKSAGRLTYNGISCVNWGLDIVRKPVFSVKGTTVLNSIFYGSPVDEILKADSDTKFRGCSFQNCLSETPSRNASIWLANVDLDDCIIDIDFQDTWSLFQSKRTYSRDLLSADTKRFFKTFARGHDFRLTYTTSAIKGIFKSRTGRTASDFLKAAEKYSLLEPNGKHKDSALHIPNRKEKSVRKFVMDSIESLEIREMIDDIYGS